VIHALFIFSIDVLQCQTVSEFAYTQVKIVIKNVQQSLHDVRLEIEYLLIMYH